MDAKEIKLREELREFAWKEERNQDSIFYDETTVIKFIQSLQDKVRELESELTKFTEVSNKHINDLDSLIVELQSALTESKLREERYREGLNKIKKELEGIDSEDATKAEKKICTLVYNLLSSNQADKG